MALSIRLVQTVLRSLPIARTRGSVVDVDGDADRLLARLVQQQRDGVTQALRTDRSARAPDGWSMKVKRFIAPTRSCIRDAAFSMSEASVLIVHPVAIQRTAASSSRPCTAAASVSSASRVVPVSTRAEAAAGSAPCASSHSVSALLTVGAFDWRQRGRRRGCRALRRTWSIASNCASVSPAAPMAREVFSASASVCDQQLRAACDGRCRDCSTRAPGPPTCARATSSSRPAVRADCEGARAVEHHCGRVSPVMAGHSRINAGKCSRSTTNDVRRSSTMVPCPGDVVMRE